MNTHGATASDFFKTTSTTLTLAACREMCLPPELPICEYSLMGTAKNETLMEYNSQHFIGRGWTRDREKGYRYVDSALGKHVVAEGNFLRRQSYL